MAINHLNYEIILTEFIWTCVNIILTFLTYLIREEIQIIVHEIWIQHIFERGQTKSIRVIKLIRKAGWQEVSCMSLPNKKTRTKYLTYERDGGMAKVKSGDWLLLFICWLMMYCEYFGWYFNFIMFYQILQVNHYHGVQY